MALPIPIPWLKTDGLCPVLLHTLGTVGLLAHGVISIPKKGYDMQILKKNTEPKPHIRRNKNVVASHTSFCLSIINNVYIY